MSDMSWTGGMARLLLLLVVSLLLGGCAATYVPMSWGMGPRVKALAKSDPFLDVLFSHCDANYNTLRVAGESFDEVMMPSEVKYHLGAYRADSKLLYRNIAYQPNDDQLRDLMVHELAHHCWFTVLSEEQRNKWVTHLASNPSPLQNMVRRVYHNPGDYNTEDFAFTVEYARPEDIQALVSINAITNEEGVRLLKSRVEKQIPFEKDPSLVAKPAKGPEEPGT